MRVCVCCCVCFFLLHVVCLFFYCCFPGINFKRPETWMHNNNKTKKEMFSNACLCSLLRLFFLLHGVLIGFIVGSLVANSNAPKRGCTTTIK